VTAHHVAALLIAAAMMVACGVSAHCDPARSAAVAQLATAIVAGAVGNAMAVTKDRSAPPPPARRRRAKGKGHGR
jgi:hypothetical protein